MAYRATQFQSVDAALFEQRSSQRHPVTITSASVRKLGKKPVEATLRDISLYGCRIESTLKHQRGDKVWVGFGDNLPIAAVVAWATSGMIGCRFDAPIDRSLLRSLVLSMI